MKIDKHTFLVSLINPLSSRLALFLNELNASQWLLDTILIMDTVKMSQLVGFKVDKCLDFWNVNKITDMGIVCELQIKRASELKKVL